MEKKYYFRGLGLGIIVTAVIMGIALSGGGKKEKMTDDEIIARARELGMVEDSALLEVTREETENAQDGDEAASAEKENAVKKDIAVAEQKEEAEKKEEEAKKKEEEAASEQEKSVTGALESLQEKENKAAEELKSGETDKPEPAEEKPAADTNEMTKQDEDIPKSETGTETKKSVTISSGDSSFTVAKKLAEAGVVSSAGSFDDFLCANGYDKRLRPGTFEIPAKAGDEEIAKIVTGQQ